MRNVYRAMFILLLLAGIGCLNPMPARAADRQSIVVGSAQGKPGDTGIEVPIKVVHNPGVNSLELTVTYDTTRLQLKEDGVHTNAGWGGLITPSPADITTKLYNGEVEINWVAERNYTVEDSAFVTLSFDIPENAPGGAAKIEAVCGEGTGSENSEYLQFQVQNGAITVSGDPGEGGAKVVVDAAAVCKPGDTGITVPIRIVNNPGINMIGLRVSYDGSALILRDVQFNSSVWSGLAVPTIPEAGPGSRTALLNWSNTNICSVSTSTFATLTFDISRTAAGSVYPIAVVCVEDNTGVEDSVGGNVSNVAFACQNGSVTVEAGSLSAVLQAHNKRNVALTGSTGGLSNCTRAFAAHYDAGMKMDAVAVSTQISADQQMLTFNREVGSGWWLFLLDSRNGPVCKKLPIS